MTTLAVTPGEPAGIGPDLVIMAAQQRREDHLIVIADPDVLLARARALGLALKLVENEPCFQAGILNVLPVRAPAPVSAGELNPDNARYVITTLELGADGCLDGRFDGLVTAPVQKSVINEAGIPFTGHTEFLATRCGVEQVVMLLVAGGALGEDDLRVALATTHVPLREVADLITTGLLRSVIRVLVDDLRHRFGIARPKILISGLNPHAGEDGHLGREEQTVIGPTLSALRDEGLELIGPLPADTLFTPAVLRGGDAVLAMYHDQGLPVLKHVGFGAAVNVTLGLPIVRTSVDHGTALNLAGTGEIDSGSFEAALALGAKLSRRESGKGSPRGSPKGPHR